MAKGRDKELVSGRERKGQSWGNGSLSYIIRAVESVKGRLAIPFGKHSIL